MDLFDLVAKITLDSSEYKKELDNASGKVSSFGDKIKSGFATAGKVAMAGLAASGTAVVALGKQAVEAYANYEQLVGGVETLFKGSAGTVQEYAANAYKTAGLSANEYMETVTSFSASLLQSLGGDTEQAAKIGDMAITDMADNANKMGTSMESIQNAYQGFAKQNYTMLDNLKLGYGGTKEEMERLLADATALSGVEYDIQNLSDVYEAIHVIQTELGITGTTAAEASETISGSVAAMQSAWQNLIVGVADENANFDELVNNFVESAVTAADNILPRVEQALNGIGQLVESLAPVIISALPVLVENVLPGVLSAAVSLVSELIKSLPEILSAVAEAIPVILNQVFSSIESILPESLIPIFEKLKGAINGVIEWLQNLDEGQLETIETIAEVVAAIVGVVLAVNTAIKAVSAVSSAISFLTSPVGLAIAAIAALVAAGVLLVKNWDKIKEAAGKVAGWISEKWNAAVSGISGAIQNAVDAIVNMASTIWEVVSGLASSAWNWGSDLIANFIDGIVAQAQELWNTIKDIGQGIRNLIGFSEPKEGPLSNFHTYAPDMMDLFAKGVRDNEGMLRDTVADAFDFGDATIEASKNINVAGTGAARNSNGVINIVVQSVLDGRVIGETAYRYEREMMRAMG